MNDADTQDSKIALWLNELNSAIGIARELTSQVENKLSSVLREPNPKETSKDDCEKVASPETSLTMLAEELRALTRRVHELSEHQRNVFARIDL